MKKSSLIAAIVAGVSFILFGVSCFFVKWDRQNFDATPSVLITSIIAFAILCVLFVLFVLLLENKSKLLMIVPTLGFFFVNIVFNKGITEVLNAQGINPASSVLTMLSPSENTVLGLLLAIAFITSIVLIQLKNYKWASLIAIIYSVILVVTTYNYTAEVLFAGNMLYLFVSLGALFALASLVIFFTAPLIPNNEIAKSEKPAKVKEEKAPKAEEKVEETVTKEAANEEAPAEETPVEENNDNNEVAEEKKEETEASSDEDNEEEKENNEPQDPFKNQYASSETVFDVQEDAEDK